MATRVREPEHYYVTAALLRPLMLGLTALGLDVQAFAAEAGLTMEQLQRPDTRISVAQTFALFRGAARASGDENLGLRLANLYQPGVFGVLDYLATTGRTLHDAIEVLCRYERIHQNAMVTSLSVTGARATIHHAVLHPLEMPREVSDSTMANLVVIGRRLTGSNFSPIEVRFMHSPPRDESEHRRLFRCPLVWRAPADVMVLEASVLETPLLLTNVDLGGALDRYARELLAKVGTAADLSARVRAQLCEELPRGDASVERVAQALGMSARTLQRGLRDENTSYVDLLEGLRATLAEKYLQQDDLGVEDVALLVGFSDARAFRRAFRRWTGRSPSTFRRGGGTEG